MPVLEVQSVDAGYDTSHVLHQVSLELEQGEVVALLGRNGAGKSTTLRAIMGLNPPWRGQVRLEGAVISGRRPWEIAGAGVAWVPEDRRVFARLTVWENLEVASRRPRDGVVRWSPQRIWELFPELAQRMHQPGARLSGGEQQMLAIARALVSHPRVLLLDEPTQGLAPVVVKRLGELLSSLAAEVPILLAEQNVRFALQLAHRVYVIDDGRIRYQGSADSLRADPEAQLRLLAVGG
ncbi:MAG TPA: ABC transporter ATP-binding protein [Limnochordales bacterium]